MPDEIVHLPPRSLLPPKHPRQHSPADLEKLEASIQRLGVLQPITVIREGERYRIVNGAGRAKICDRIGIPVPARVLAGVNPLLELESTFHENEARCPMSPVEKAEFLLTHMKLSGGTQEGAAEALGISPSLCSKLLTVKGKLAPELLEHVHAGKLDIGSGYEIAKVADHAKQVELAGLVMEGKLKRESVINRVKQINGGKLRKEKPVKVHTACGMVLIIPAAAFDVLTAAVKKVGEGILKCEKLGLPISSLPSLLKS